MASPRVRRKASQSAATSEGSGVTPVWPGVCAATMRRVAGEGPDPTARLPPHLQKAGPRDGEAWKERLKQEMKALIGARKQPAGCCCRRCWLLFALCAAACVRVRCYRAGSRGARCARHKPLVCGLLDLVGVVCVVAHSAPGPLYCRSALPSPAPQRTCRATRLPTRIGSRSSRRTRQVGFLRGAGMFDGTSATRHAQALTVGCP